MPPEITPGVAYPEGRTAGQIDIFRAAGRAPSTACPLFNEGEKFVWHIQKIAPAHVVRDDNESVSVEGMLRDPHVVLRGPEAVALNAAARKRTAEGGRRGIGQAPEQVVVVGAGKLI